MSEKRKNRIFIFHFLPIELYPPAINFAQYLSDQHTDGKSIECVLLSTKPNKTVDLVGFDNVKIIRLKGIEKDLNVFVKVWRYITIYSLVLFYLLKLKPRTILYYESLSSLPIIIYSFFTSKIKIYIHYHELFTSKQLERGRTLHKFLNQLEVRFLYHKMIWLSHTNHERMNIFLEQYNLAYNSSHHKTLPNYPSKKVFSASSKGQSPPFDLAQRKDKIRLLHIGSLSFDGLYLNEILQEFGNNDKFEISFYSHATDKAIIEKLESYDNVHFMGSINYIDIPNLKYKFDVGLVLYKGNSLNFTYNAPNKIFEYLALDLDVWCSKNLLTAHQYTISNSYPKMLIVDFENLSSINVEELLDKDGLNYKNTPYFCEAVYEPLLNHMYENFNTKL